MTKKKNFSKTVAAITAISLAAATPLSAFADVIEGGDGEGGTYIYTYDSEDIKDFVSNDESANGITIKDYTDPDGDERKDIIEKANAKVEINGDIKDKVLSSINYIIKGSVLENGKDTQNGKIVLKGTSGSVTVGDQTYDTAHQDENLTINVETVVGYKYSLSDSQGLLVKNADGSYTLKVPAGGGVDLKAVLEKIEEQQTNTDTNNKKNDITVVSSHSGRNSESSHIVGSSSGNKSGSTLVALIETPGAWAKDANNNWIYVNNGFTYTNTWIVAKNKWYYLNNNGNPVSNWQTLLNKQYFFSAEDTTAHPFGSLYVSSLTPDGVYVDSNGSRLS